MSKRNINFMANVVMPIVVIAITVTLFLMFKPKETASLFYINLWYTVFLEAIFFGYLNILYVKTKDISTPYFAVFGIYCLYYIVSGFVWMLAYSLMLVHLPYIETHKLYIAVLIALTLSWIIISVITAQTDADYRQSLETLKKRGQSLNFCSQKTALLVLRYKKLCARKGLKYEKNSSSQTELDRLVAKISFLTPNVFRNETAVAQITALLDRCEDLIDEMKSATGENAEAVQMKMQCFVDSAVAELDMVKTLVRG